MIMIKIGIVILIILLGWGVYPTVSSFVEDYQNSLRPTECATESDRLGRQNAMSVLSEAQRVYVDNYANGKIESQITLSQMDMYRVTYCWYIDN